MSRLWRVLIACLAVSACGGGGGGGGGPTPTPAPGHVLFVRTSGSDDNDGTTPDQALQSVVHAAQLLRPGVTVYVGPGRYVGRVDIASVPGTESAPVKLLADPNGEHTLDMPGAVILDADGDIFTLRLSTTPYLSVDGFTITGAAPVGSTSGTQIEIRSSAANAAIRNCVITDGGPADGIRLQDSDSVLLFDNLIVGNNRGIVISGAATNARLINNTIADNRATAVTIKESGSMAPTGGMLRNNIIQDSNNNVSISVSSGPPSSLTGYSGDFNLSFVSGASDQTKPYRPSTIRGNDDVNADAMFADAMHGDFHLDSGSPAIDAGTKDIDMALVDELQQRSATSDGALDTALPDLGYHYPVPQ
jgi:parallel beta-helix repeat protein